MTHKRVSYRNPFFSAILFALLYFFVSNFFYWVFNGHLSFVPYHYFEWMEYALGTIVMFVLVFVLELIRNMLGGKGGDNSDTGLS